MRVVGTIVGVFLIISGAIWFLQGISLLPGSFMTGQARWAVYGAATIVVGVAIIAFGRRQTDG